MKSIYISEDDEIMFLEYSEKGKHKDKISGIPYVMDGFNALIQGKRWRGIHIHEMYEKGILDGTMPYIILLENMPRSVIEFLQKEMFRGEDKDIIDKVDKVLRGELDSIFE